nr:unnamed protein product [Callosobruchus chinensis]
MLAKAMVQMLPPNERKVIRLRLDKLMQTDKTKDHKQIRNKYVWFILLMLQCKKVREPFNGTPPPELAPLRRLNYIVLEWSKKEYTKKCQKREDGNAYL